MIRMMAGPRMTMNSDGKMHPTSGNSILIGAFAACSSARCRRSIRSCSDWTWSTFEIDTPSCSAWMIAPMKFVSGADFGSRDDVAERLAARLADANLGERPAELLGERTLELLDDLAERGVEAETGPDGDRQEVERVRDHEQDRVLALLDPPAEPELRDRVAEQQPDDADITKLSGIGSFMKPTTTNRKKKRIAPTTAPMALTPSQSATRRLPGLPARARRFSAFSWNELLAIRETRRTARRPAGAGSARGTAAGARAPRGSWPAWCPSWVRRAWTGSTGELPVSPTTMSRMAPPRQRRR